ncbi:hypothetical protein [Streptomyces sp. URMC 123]|uniref:hypothetical protein n=1 Tax=Streptomyces sp. URMC 123 TaxID=3423403 RepID=UPI003F1C68BB
MARRARITAPAAAVTIAVAAAVLTGCGGQDKGADKPPSSPSASTGARPAYSGKKLPGLAATAAWSLPKPSGGASVIAVGDAFAVVSGGPGAAKPSEGGPNGDRDPARREGPKTVEFRDAGSGSVRATVTVEKGRVYAATWHGAPALRVDVEKDTPSDGLTAAKRATVSEIYDARGKKLGQADTSAGSRRIDDAWVFDSGRKVTPVEGGQEHTLPGNKEIWRTQGPAETDRGRTGEPGRLAIGDHVFTSEEAPGASPFVHPKRLIVSEAATGRKVWTAAEAEKPARAVGEGPADGPYARPVTVVGDKAVLAWRTTAEGKVTEPWQLAVHDIRTGRLVATGPTVQARSWSIDQERVGEDQFLYVTYDPSTGLLATTGRTDSARELTTVWELATGKQVWTQEQDETSLAPLSAGNGVLYGATSQYAGTWSQLVAVDLRTKQVLAKPGEVETDEIPAFSSTGHGAVVLDEGVFVFPKQ